MDEPEVSVGRGARVVVDEETGERRRQALTGLQPPPFGLQGGEGVLVLPSPRRQVTTETRGRPPGPGRQAVDVERVGRPRDHRGRAGEHAPRGHTRLGEVLAHRERRAEAVAVERRDVQVLAHVQLVGAQHPGCREGDVVGVHDVDLTCRGPVVEHLDVPRPRGVVGVEGEGHPPAEARRRPGPVTTRAPSWTSGGGTRPGPEHRPAPAARPVAEPQLQQPRGEGRGGVLHQLDPVRAEGGRRAAVHDDRAQAPGRLEHPRRAVRDRASRDGRRRARARNDVCCRAQAAARVVSIVGSAHSPTIPAPNSSMPMTGRSAFSTSGVLKARAQHALAEHVAQRAHDHGLVEREVAPGDRAAVHGDRVEEATLAVGAELVSGS